jgi:hypothetical protein
MTSTTGKYVSTSAIARQLLESASESPGSRGSLYPIRGYPAVTEFGTMLATLGSDHPRTHSWSDAHFIGYIVESQRSGRSISLRVYDNGITFQFLAEDWRSVDALMRRAWDMPDVRAALDARLRWGVIVRRQRSR